MVRRQAGHFLPTRETRDYQAWIGRRSTWRHAVYKEPVEPGLLSVLTPVWEGSPIRYLKTLADSIVDQNTDGACEWVILDNGLSRQSLRAYLEVLSKYSWVKVHRVPKNVGITAGLRICLERARGRYVLPVDADDYLYNDALRVAASCIRQAGYPSLLYSDEDKICGTQPCQPFMKPDWDPVLFLNAAYVAHLGVIERKRALELGVYSDSSAEGSADWDAFMRFKIAGYTPVHIPEILYSWRIHAKSTADDVGSKQYIHESHRAVLQRFLDSRPIPARFSIQYSPLLDEAARWRLVREHRDPKPCLSIAIGRNRDVHGNEPASLSHLGMRQVGAALTADYRTLLRLLHEMEDQDGLVHFIGDDVRIENDDWFWEALGLFELHEDAVMVGGRIRNSSGIVTGAGLQFGFSGAWGCPDRGRSFQDCGYFGQMWKQHSVSAVSVQFAVIKARFLAELLRQLPPSASLPFLGAWAGAHALRTGNRIVYSPFLSGTSDLDWETLYDDSEQALFAEANRDLIPDSRFYSRHFSLEKPFALRESAEMAANA